MKLCKDCRNQGKKKKCQFYNPMSNYAEKCPHFEKIKRTNADRIRSMSDEELAEYMAELIRDTYEHQYCDSTDDWLIWLQSEVEG